MRFLLFSVLCCGVLASAVNGAGSKSNAPTKPGPVPPSGPKTPTGGDPVGYVDGSVYDTIEDLRVPCPDIDLVFRRSYGSWSTSSGALGYGWTHSYEWRLVDDGDTVCVYVAGEDGPSDAVHAFDRPRAGASTVDSDGYELVRSQDGCYSLVTPTARKYCFNGMGLLEYIETWNGTRVTLERASQGSRVSRVVHQCGKALSFEYDDTGHLVRVATPEDGVYVEVATAKFGMMHVLSSVIRHDGDSASTNTYSYARPPSAGEWDELSSRMGMIGDGPGGRSVRMPIRNPLSAQMKALSTRPLLQSKVDANGLKATFEYARQTDSPAVKCIKTELDGGLFETRFGFGDGVTVERKPTAWGVAEMTFLYDSNDRETSRTTGSETVSTEYDAAGDVARERLFNSDTTAFVERRKTYDARHRAVSAGIGYCSSPTNYVSLVWDDRRNIPSRIVTPEGRVSEWMESDGVVTVYGAGSSDARNVTRIALTESERPQTVFMPDGGRKDFAYDDSGYVTNIAWSCLPSVSLGYDALGHVNSKTMPGPNGTTRTTTYVNNWRGEALSVVWPDGTGETFSYDGEGENVVRHIDALGREDAYKRVFGLAVHAGRVINGVTNTLFGVEHDKQLNVVAITDPLGRNAETYVLDENERIVAVTNVEGLAMTRTYAVGDRVSSETRFDGTSVSYSYDGFGNLASVEFPGDKLLFERDGDGLLVGAANSAGVVSNEYDASTGWLVTSHGVDGTEVAYSYSNGGSVVAVASVAGATSYSRDDAGRRVSISSPAGTFRLGYSDWNGGLSALTNGHGFVVEYAYDIMDRVTNIAWKTESGVSLGGFAYGYDALGRIVSRDHELGGESFGRAYSYDDRDRLASDGDVAYIYDAAGNRMTRTEDGTTTTYALGVGDRLASWTGGAYSYDAAGNVTRIVRDGRPTLDLAWNGRYQLVSVSTNGVFAEGYAYDALGRRVSTTTADGTKRHVYDDSWQVVADIDEQGNVVASYTWGAGIDRLLAVRIGGANYYPLTDIQGTVWGYVDSANNVVARWQYDAWGNVVGEDVSVTELATLRYRFQGREWSAATGLVHFRNRWYDAETGRWLSKDPIRLSGGLNLYAFCGNDPVNCTDSLGLKKDNKKSGGSRGGSGGGNGDGGGSTPGDITLGDGGDKIEGLFDKVGDFWNDHIKDRLDGVNSAVQTGALPTTMGTAAAALDGVAIGGALARGISEWRRSMSLLQSGALEANDPGHELQKCEHTVHRASSGIDSAMNIKK